MPCDAATYACVSHMKWWYPLHGVRSAISAVGSSLRIVAKQCGKLSKAPHLAVILAVAAGSCNPSLCELPCCHPPWCGSKLETITGYTSLRNERNTSNARASHRFVHAPCVQVNPWPSSKGRCDDCLTRGVVHVRIRRGAIAGPSKLYRCVGRRPAVRIHWGAAVGGLLSGRC